jgi:hypothetical protein
MTKTLAPLIIATVRLDVFILQLFVMIIILALPINVRKGVVLIPLSTVMIITNVPLINVVLKPENVNMKLLSVMIITNVLMILVIE